MIRLVSCSSRLTGGDCRYAASPAPAKGEHSGHLARNTLNSAASNAALGGNLEHALSGPQLILDTLF